jgi:hypothetical protein
MNKVNNIATTVLGYAFIGAALYDLVEMHNLSGFDVAFITFTGVALIIFKEEGLKEITRKILNKK